jgi:hypothetical protein
MVLAVYTGTTMKNNFFIKKAFLDQGNSDGNTAIP